MMNERIRELARQAGFEHPDHVGTCEIYAYFDHEKFAELIVRECEQVSLKNSHRNDDMGAIIAKQIKKHFEVES